MPVEYMRKVKPRKLSWNEKLAQKGIASWEQMLAEIKAI